MTQEFKSNLISEIEALEIKFKALPCDNNGNPVDWKSYDRLLTKIEALEAILFDHTIDKVTVSRF